jgi:hypothetical protein
MDTKYRESMFNVTPFERAPLRKPFASRLPRKTLFTVHCFIFNNSSANAFPIGARILAAPR